MEDKIEKSDYHLWVLVLSIDSVIGIAKCFKTNVALKILRTYTDKDPYDHRSFMCIYLPFYSFLSLSLI